MTGFPITEEIFRALKESPLVGLVIYQDSRLVFANAALAAMTGYPVEELLEFSTEQAFAMIHPEDREMVRQRIQDRLTGLPAPARYECRILQKNGGIGWVELASSRISYEGRPAVQTSLVDISEHKRAVEALRKSEERYRQLAENFPNGTVNIYDRDLRLTFVAGGDLKKYGRTADEFIGKTFQQLAPAETFAIAEPHLRAAFQGQTSSYETPYWYDRYYLVNVAPLRNDEGEIHEIMVVTQNLTERKHAEKALQASHEKLRALTARLSEVEEEERRNITRELHDRVGQILTALNINLNILREQIPAVMAGSLGSRVEESIHLVEQAVARVRDVMADLHPPVLEDYGLSAALQWYVNPLSRRMGIPIRVEEVGEASARLPSRLEAVLFRVAQEALNNAARHAGAAQVSIRLEWQGNLFRMVIEDDGRGFDPAMAVEPNERPRWGLATMRERIEAAGGSFRVESEPGRGTKVITEMAPGVGE